MPPRAAWAMMTRQARRPSAIQHDTVRCGFLSQRSYVAPSPRSHTAPKWPRKELTYCPIYGFKSCVICTKDLTPELFCLRPHWVPTLAGTAPPAPVGADRWSALQPSTHGVDLPGTYPDRHRASQLQNKKPAGQGGPFISTQPQPRGGVGSGSSTPTLLDGLSYTAWSSRPVSLATITGTSIWPVTFVIVRIMSRMRSMAYR